MFKDKFGCFSSKRIIGFAVLVYVCLLVGVSTFAGMELAGEFFFGLLGAGTTLLGLGVAERNK